MVRDDRTVLSKDARAEGGLRLLGLERMLRTHLLQPWCALSDPTVAEALYDAASMRRLMGIDRGREPAPAKITVCQFRPLLEKHGLANELITSANRQLHNNGMRLSQGMLVAASILGAPSSTKNRNKARNPEMQQTKKGNQWYFGNCSSVALSAASMQSSA